MTETRRNREFLIKYCKIMLNKLDNREDEERMGKWLEAVTSSQYDKAMSHKYLELILWALHTQRINVFPFKYLPPVDNCDITDVYKYASEIVQSEPESNISYKRGEVNTIVTDDLKEYFAVQKVPGFGTQCFYAFSDSAPVSCWTMPCDMNVSFQNEFVSEPKYWMTLFSKPDSTKNAIYNLDEEIKAIEEEEYEESEYGKMSESKKPICPDLSKVENILNNLSFGGRTPQNVRNLIDEDYLEYGKRRSTMADGARERRIRECRREYEWRKANAEFDQSRGSNFCDLLRDFIEVGPGPVKKDLKEENNKDEGGVNVTIDSYVLSVDYLKNQSGNSSDTKKKNKNKGSTRSQNPSTKNANPQSAFKPSWQKCTLHSYSLDSIDELNCIENTSLLRDDMYKFDEASKDNVSALTLSRDSLCNDDDYLLMKQSLPKSRMNAYVKSINPHFSHRKVEHNQNFRKLDYDHQVSSQCKNYSSVQREQTLNDDKCSKTYSKRGFSLEPIHNNRPIHVSESTKNFVVEPDFKCPVPPSGSNKKLFKSQSRTSQFQPIHNACSRPIQLSGSTENFEDEPNFRNTVPSRGFSNNKPFKSPSRIFKSQPIHNSRPIHLSVSTESFVDEPNFRNTVPSRGFSNKRTFKSPPRTSQFKSIHNSRPIYLSGGTENFEGEPNTVSSRGFSKKNPFKRPSRTSLSNSIRSERRLHFSDVHVEPILHRPKLYSESPLKPCLRKSSDEYPSSG